MQNNLTGKTFGQWTVLGPGEDYIGPWGHHIGRWRVQCTCGTESLVITASLTGGRSYRCRKCADAERRPPNSPK